MIYILNIYFNNKTIFIQFIIININIKLNYKKKLDYNSRIYMIYPSYNN